MILDKPRRHKWWRSPYPPSRYPGPRIGRPMHVGNVLSGFYVDRTGQMWGFVRDA